MDFLGSLLALRYTVGLGLLFSLFAGSCVTSLCI